MNGEVIKQFLVGLGFGIDETSLSKFNKAIADATMRVTALYASVKVAAAGIFYGISKISESFEEMGYNLRIIAPAINKYLVLRKAMLSAYAAAGINLREAIQQSVRFNYSLAKTKFALEAIYKSVGAKFFPMLTKQMDLFRQKIYTHMPRIKAVLQDFVSFVFKAFEAVWLFGSRAVEIFTKLHNATNGWSTGLIALYAAFRYLMPVFTALLTPLGILLSSIATLILLWDDFKTFQAGGESLIDWSNRWGVSLGILVGVIAAISPAMKIASAGMLAFELVAKGVVAVINAWKYAQIALNVAMYANPLGLFVAATLAAIAAVTSLAYALGKLAPSNVQLAALNPRFTEFANQGRLNPQFFNPANFATAPVNPGTAGGGNNATLHNQTSITVQGSASQGAIQQINNGQEKVMFDAVQNLKGATR